MLTLPYSLDYPALLQGDKNNAPRNAYQGNIILMNQPINVAGAYTAQSFLHWVAGRIAADQAGNAQIRNILLELVNGLAAPAQIAAVVQDLVHAEQQIVDNDEEDFEVDVDAL